MQNKKNLKTPFGILRDHNGKEFFLLEKKTFFAIIAISVLTLVIYFFRTDARQFLTSVLQPLPEHAPYDGVVPPIQYVPNWSKLTEAERKSDFSNIPKDKLIPLPLYKPEHLVIPFESLAWGNPEHQTIRNEKITYTTPYLGSYELDGAENRGSHPAVDIKVPVSTPVFAIGNAVVMKVASGNGGFGNHVVLLHRNFPSLEDPSRLENLYSSYSHLRDIVVTNGQVVRKGELIGFSGMSGLATTPHLHFQIDRDTTDFHPFWPFNGSELREAGLTFFQAMNSGFKKEVAAIHTIHPLNYIQKYAAQEALVAAFGVPALTTPAQEASIKKPELRFIIQPIGGPFIEGTNIPFLIRLMDSDGNIVKKPKFDERIKLELLASRGALNRKFLVAGFFFTGETDSVILQNPSPGKEKLILRYKDSEYSSEEFEILSKQIAVEVGSALVASNPPLPAQPETLPLGKSYVSEDVRRMSFPRFEITLDRRAVEVGQTVNGMLQYFDKEARNITPDTEQIIFLSLLMGQGELSTYVVKKENFLDGKFIFTIVPQGEGMVVVQASGIGINGFSEGLEVKFPKPPSEPASTIPVENPSPPPQSQELVFSDIPADSELEEPLRFLKDRGIIKGYPDGSFQPKRPVLRVEALKIIFEALNESVTDLGALLFPDIEANAWYLPFVEKAYREAIVRGYPDGTFRPNANVNLVEFLKMLFLASKIDLNPEIIIQLPDGVKDDDWFAPFIQEALLRNLLLAPSEIEPGKPLTREDVALMIYRLLKNS